MRLVSISKAGGRLSAQSNLMTFKWKPITVTVLFTVCFKT